MKKFLLILLAIFMLTSCVKPQDFSGNESPTESQSELATEIDKKSAGLIEYFPFAADSVYVYEGTGVDSASYSTYFGYIYANKAQRRVFTNEVAATEVLEVKDGELALAYGDAANYFYDNILNMGSNLRWVLLKEPLEVGNKWNLSEDSVREITEMNKKVTTPMGELEAMEVVTTHKNGKKDYDYFVKNIGLVKSVYDSQKGEITSTLKEIKKDTAIEVKSKVYFPNVTKNTTKSFENMVFIKTNDDFIKQFEKAMKEDKGDDFVPLLTENTKIQSIVLDWKKSLATVDLSQEYLDEINVGDGVQTSILQCIANTVGEFYGAKNVKVTINQKPFENGSIAFSDDEYLTVEKETKDE